MFFHKGVEVGTRRHDGIHPAIHQVGEGFRTRLIGADSGNVAQVFLQEIRLNGGDLHRDGFPFEGGFQIVDRFFHAGVIIRRHNRAAAWQRGQRAFFRSHKAGDADGVLMGKIDRFSTFWRYGHRIDHRIIFTVDKTRDHARPFLGDDFIFKTCTFSQLRHHIRLIADDFAARCGLVERRISRFSRKLQGAEIFRLAERGSGEQCHGQRSREQAVTHHHINLIYLLLRE